MGTVISPSGPQLRARQHWIVFTLKPRGTLLIDAGAARVLREGRASLLPVGVLGVRGHFNVGDAVRVVDPGGIEVARGLARFNDRPVMVIGHEKGHDTKSRILHNFGMARPEGYRKAVRLMDMAGKFGLPVITLVDTAGAYPGKGAEERGQSEAIARSTEKCLQIGVPLISIIIGEGGSGGAVAFATADRVAMLEHSIYSVISPEGCASILWKDSEKMREAAEALRLTAQDLEKLGVNDRIIKEPLGGAHRDRTAAMNAVGAAIASMLAELDGKSPGKLIKDRRRKFLDLGSKGLAA